MKKKTLRKALKNIPKPDEEKLAIFYGNAPEPAIPPKREPEMSTVDKMSAVDKKTAVDRKTTVDKKTTVVEMSTVVNADLLRDKVKLLITTNQQSVYLSLYKRASAIGKNVTHWVGYNELAKEIGISQKTVQRSIDKLINTRLIKRTKLANTAEIKGSQYQVILPEGLNTVDILSTVFNEPQTGTIY